MNRNRAALKSSGAHRAAATHRDRGLKQLARLDLQTRLPKRVDNFFATVLIVERKLKRGARLFASNKLIVRASPNRASHRSTIQVGCECKMPR